MKTKLFLSAILTSAICFYSSFIFAQCQAGFTFTINGAVTSFTNTSTGTTGNTAYSWNFGDGGYASVSNPAPHTYQYAGTYTVCLYIGDSASSCSNTFCNTVVIVNAPHPPCTATFSAQVVDSIQTFVNFTNQSSYNVQWHWNFGDGNTSTMQNPVHQYSVNDTYSVCLTTITNLGDTCSFCDTINSTPCSQILTTSFAHTHSINTVSFTSNCSGATVPLYNWDFGDGNYSTLQNPVHTYQYNGNYSVCLYYHDNSGGCSEMFCDTVKIINSTNPPCSVNFTYSSSDSLQMTAMQVIFYSSSSIQPLQWFWNFGDGNTSTQQNPTHGYLANGTYTVCLTVIRSYYNDTCSVCHTVVISHNLLRGAVFTDANSNCAMDAGDIPLLNWGVVAQNTITQDSYFSSTDPNGNYGIMVPSGDYLVSIVSKQYYSNVCPLSPPSYSVSVTIQDTINNLNFGEHITNSCTDLSVGIVASHQRRCLKNNYYYVQYSNNGTIAASNVLLKVDFDSPNGRVIPLNSSLAWDSISGTEYFWKLGILNVGQSGTFYVTDSLSCNTVLGDTLHSYVQIFPSAGDCNTNNNYVEEHNIVKGSYDPNEKLASTSTLKVAIENGTILPTDTLSYTIGFQNTGTDTAFTVVVYDTLDTHLNPASVISGMSSHPYTFELSGTGILKWTFSNILLPDSNVNEPASHGFVKFRILQNANNPIGTVIKNSAGIVFDFNAPVITDTVVLTVSNLVGVGDMKEDDNIISVYPNPTNGMFTIKMEDVTGQMADGQIEIYNVFGEKVYSKTVNRKQETVNLNVPEGIYFVKVQTSKGSVGSKKMVVVK